MPPWQNEPPARSASLVIHPHAGDAVVLFLADHLADPNIGALTITLGFWGILCHNYHKEPQK